jgi:hypothetical protein
MRAAAHVRVIGHKHASGGQDHGEHDAQVAERIHRCGPVISNDRWCKESRKLEPTVAVWNDQHGDLDALVFQSGDAPGPLSFDHGATFELDAEFGEECNGGDLTTSSDRAHHAHCRSAAKKP